MILYDYVLSASCYKVRLMAALLGKPLTLKTVNFYPEKEHKSVSMQAISAAGTLPVLVDGERVLTQSNEMLKHLAAQETAWLGGDDVVPWLELSGALNDSLGMARLHDILSYEVDVAKARRDGVALLRQLEAHLAEQRFDGHLFLTGALPTIADVACFPNVALAPDGGVSLDPYPSIRLWMRAIRSLPGFIEMPGIHRLHELAPEPEVTA